MTYLPQRPSPKDWGNTRLVLVFATQVVTGTALFILIAALAIGLNLGAHWMEAHLEVDALVLWILKVVEILILVVDTTLFVAYILIEARGLIRKMWF